MGVTLSLQTPRTNSIILVLVALEPAMKTITFDLCIFSLRRRRLR
jgi:hypothetical protein